MSILISKSSLTDIQKKVNIILVWILPLIWGLIIRFIIEPTNYKGKTGDQTNYYESGKGFWGGTGSTDFN